MRRTSAVAYNEAPTLSKERSKRNWLVTPVTPVSVAVASVPTFDNRIEPRPPLTKYRLAVPETVHACPGAALPHPEVVVRVKVSEAVAPGGASVVVVVLDVV